MTISEMRLRLLAHDLGLSLAGTGSELFAKGPIFLEQGDLPEGLVLARDGSTIELASFHHTDSTLPQAEDA